MGKCARAATEGNVDIVYPVRMNDEHALARWNGIRTAGTTMVELYLETKRPEGNR